METTCDSRKGTGLAVGLGAAALRKKSYRRIPLDVLRAAKVRVLTAVDIYEVDRTVLGKRLRGLLKVLLFLYLRKYVRYSNTTTDSLARHKEGGKGRKQ